MRLALFSDIHGNPIALEAVLADIRRQGEVDAYWVLGDFSGIGYDPVTPIETIATLSHVSCIRGNTDRYVVTADLPVPPAKVLEKPALLSEVIEATRSFSWTRGYVSAAGRLDWLTNLPQDVRLTLPDGTRVLGVHASPGRDDGPGLHPKDSDEELEDRLAGCEADLVIAGHTHVPMDRQVGQRRIINLGSVSNPVTPGLYATYALLEADAQGYYIQLRRVKYDREAVIKAIEQARHPCPSFLIGFMRGERITTPDPGSLQEEIIVRNASPNDIEAIATLHADSWRRHYRGAYSDAFLDGEVVDDRRNIWRERLTATDENHFTLVADRDGQVVGFVHMLLDDDPEWGALLDNLHVSYQFKRHGIGRRLLTAAARELTQRRPADTRFYLWVLDQNTAAQAFYAACGGRDVETALEGPVPGGSNVLCHRIAWSDTAIFG